MIDWDQAEARAKTIFLKEQERATFQGRPASDDYVQGSEEGWEAAVAWIKSQIVSQFLGG